MICCPYECRQIFVGAEYEVRQYKEQSIKGAVHEKYFREENDEFAVDRGSGSFCFVGAGFDHVVFLWRRYSSDTGYRGYSGHYLVYFRAQARIKRPEKWVRRASLRRYNWSIL